MPKVSVWKTIALQAGLPCTGATAVILSGAAAFILKSQDCLTVYIKGSGAHRQQTN